METTYYIYKIVCKDETITEFYIGSTSSIRHRKSQHKTSCNNEKNDKYNLKIYQIIRENKGWDNWNFIVIEELKEHTKIQAHIREEYWRKELNASLNMKKAYQTEDELKENNNERAKEWYKENIDKKKEYDKEYREQNFNKIKEYREQNKYKLNEKQKEKHDCECGGKYTNCHKLTHLKTQKHINHLEKKELK
jgi:hypothetical protein